MQSSIKEFKLEKHLNLYGYISPSKLKKYYLTSNALLITLSKGLALSKTIPSKFQTYLAYGRPLLICSNGEINKIVKNNHLGLVCSSGDVNTLYKNILSLKNMRNKAYRKICFNCFNFYKNNYFLSKKIKELEKILYNSTKKI